MKQSIAPEVVYASAGDTAPRAGEFWDENDWAYVLTLNSSMFTVAWGACETPPAVWSAPDEYDPPDLSGQPPKVVLKKSTAGLIVGQNYWMWIRLEWDAGKFRFIRVENSEVAIR